MRKDLKIGMEVVYAKGEVRRIGCIADRGRVTYVQWLGCPSFQQGFNEEQEKFLTPTGAYVGRMYDIRHRPYGIHWGTTQ